MHLRCMECMYKRHVYEVIFHYIGGYKWQKTDVIACD